MGGTNLRLTSMCNVNIKMICYDLDREIQLRGEDTSCRQPLQQPSTIVMQMSSYLYTSTQLSMCGALHLITAACTPEEQVYK